MKTKPEHNSQIAKMTFVFENVLFGLTSAFATHAQSEA